MKIWDLNKKSKIIIFSIIMVLMAIIFFNISFSLPKDFSKFIKERTTTENYDEIKKVTINKTEWIENYEIVDQDDDREFIIENENDIYSFLNSDVCVYDGGRYARDEENEYEIYLYFENGNFHRYHINENYIIARETSDIEDHVFLTVLGDNEIYNYLANLYH